MKGGEGGGVVAEETKRKISKANTGKKRSEDSKQKNRDSHIGKKASDKTKEKQSIAQTGKKKSKEHKRNISKSLKGNKRCLGRIPWNKGLTKETVNRIKKQREQSKRAQRQS
jgi:hypothetical protein